MFSKKIFALLLEKAKGDRSWRQFSIDSGVSYVQMRKLAQAVQENPPRPKLIRKLASTSENDITIEDYMFAIGTAPVETRLKAVSQRKPAATQSERFLENYKSLDTKQRRMVDEFCEFLKSKSIN